MIHITEEKLTVLLKAAISLGGLMSFNSSGDDEQDEQKEKELAETLVKMLKENKTLDMPLEQE